MFITRCVFSVHNLLTKSSCSQVSAVPTLEIFLVKIASFLHRFFMTRQSCSISFESVLISEYLDGKTFQTSVEMFIRRTSLLLFLRQCELRINSFH